MPETLHDAILKALAQPLDGTTFERCAADLLREDYPSLRPVGGGNDAGMDGVGELPDGTPFFLVATVQQDARGNLERNVQSHIDAGGERRAVVFATSRTITGQRRLELGRILRDGFDVRLAAVHDRADFAARLYRDPRWRQELLGLPGEARALSRLPATRRPTVEVSLVGRDEETERLKAADGDLVVVGKPGIGKTYLLQKLMEDDWGLFDDDWDINQLEYAIRDMQPARIVVDDAHLRGDRLARLRQLRAQMSASFAIVAVTWPGSADDTTGALRAPSRFEIDELERDEILRVIEEMGIGGPVGLQAQLINQARGCVGRAVTLASAALAGDLRDVATGDVLLQDIVGWCSLSLGAESRHVLGFLALAGNHGATLEQASAALSLAPPRLAELIRGLATGGTLDEAAVHDGVIRLRVEPPDLRYALVRDVYAPRAGSLGLRAALQHLDSPAIAALPLLGAMHRDAQFDRALVRDLIQDGDSEAALSFALLGPSELGDALERWPRFRGEIIPTAHRSDTDPVTTLPLLLDLAVGDNRAEHSHPEHPLRVIGDHIAASGSPVEMRRTTVEGIDSWLRAGGDAGVGFRALAHAMRPQVRRTFSDPGLGRTITITQGPLASDVVAQLATLWDRVLQIAAREKDGPVGSLIDGLSAWVYPGRLSFGDASFEASEHAIRSEAPRVIERMADILSEHPGALRKLRPYGARLGIEVAIPHEFGILFPDDWRLSADQWRERERSALKAVAVLAEDVRVRPLDEQVEVLAGSDAEAASAGLSYPRLTPRLAQLLAQSNTEPLAWAEALAPRRAAADLMLPFLYRSVEIEAEGYEERLLAFLEDEPYSWAAIRVALTLRVGEAVRATAIARLTGQHRQLVEVLLIQGKIDTGTAERLLDAPDPVVARDTAIALALPSAELTVSDLSEVGQARWRDVIVASAPDEYWFAEILKRDPGLFAEWLRGWFARLSDSTDHWLLPDTVIEGIGELPLHVRRELIDAIPGDAPSFPLQDVVTELVGSDLTVAAALLDRADLEEIHWVCLRRGPSESWMERALLAFDRGWQPERIVGATRFSQSAWSGEESHQWQASVDAFAALERRDDIRRGTLIDAGVRVFSDLRDRAEDAERDERVFGLRRRVR